MFWIGFADDGLLDDSKQAEFVGNRELPDNRLVF
jgi:hypothetical protein